ncbi:hypothetical protein AaE_002875, partial [Aphanomyces astaci]
APTGPATCVTEPNPAMVTTAPDASLTPDEERVRRRKVANRVRMAARRANQRSTESAEDQQKRLDDQIPC